MGLYPPKQCITLGNQVAKHARRDVESYEPRANISSRRSPKDLGIRAGTELIWDRNENGDYTIRPKRLTLADLHRIVGPSTVRLTDQEIQNARREFLASRTKRLDAKRG